MLRPSILLLLAALLTVSCSEFSLRNDPVPRTLDTAETRAVAKAWRASLFGSTIGDYTIQARNNDASLPVITDLIDTHDFRTRHSNQPGEIGIPVLINSGDPGRISVRLTPHSHQITLQASTLVARQTASNHILLEFHDPRDNPTLNGQPLARANGAIFDYIQSQQSEKLLNLRALIFPSRYDTRRGIYLANPYDPKKIPVLFVHGLASSPLAYRNMVAILDQDPEIRETYQFWFYFYPTGEPWVASAAAFRRDLTDLIHTLDPTGNDRHLHDMVLVTHSMGGLISRASVSHNSQALYDSYFDRDLDQLRLTNKQKARLRELLLYEPIPWPKRIIFMATPHQGSRLAEGPLQWLARKLIGLPGHLLGSAILSTELIAAGEPGILTSDAYPLLHHHEVSVSQLDPANPAIQSLQHMPMRRDLHLHSIIADLGGPRTPVHTDGVVRYESAHLPNTESEKVVQSIHRVTHAQSAAVEVARILRLPQ